jgi:hypothetical protein
VKAESKRERSKCLPNLEKATKRKYLFNLEKANLKRKRKYI